MYTYFSISKDTALTKSKNLPHIAVCKYISRPADGVSVHRNTNVKITLPKCMCKRLLVSHTLKVICVPRRNATHEALKYNIVRVGYASIIRLEYGTSSVGSVRWS